MNEADITKIEVPFRFTRRPMPVPPDLRPDWRVAVLLLMLYHSRGKKASIKKLNLINWAIRSYKNRKDLLDHLENKDNSSGIIVRIEPGISRAIDIAKGYGLIEIEYGSDTTIKLTSSGKGAVEKINSIEDSFKDEREFLLRIKPHVNEKDIDALYTGEN